MKPQQVHLRIGRLVIDAASAATGRAAPELLAQAIQAQLAGLWDAQPASGAARSGAPRGTLAQAIAASVGQRLAAELPDGVGVAGDGDGHR